MPFSRLWGRITGKDKGQRVPNQQVSALGRLGDPTIVFPYGIYADLPDNVLLKEIAPNVFIPVTEVRPDDLNRGEPTFFHPATNTRMITRDNGDLDIITAESEGSVNITAATAVTIDAPETTITGNLTVQGGTALGATVTSGGKNIGGTHTHGGSPTAATGPISPTGTPI